MTAKDIEALKQMWQEAFGDPADFCQLFFAKGFSPDRFLCIRDDGLPVSALYWFDCELDGHRLAYIYGVATLKSHRGKGLATRLMADAHEALRQQGYAGAILVPEKETLFEFYRKLGYRNAATVAEISCDPADTPLPLRQIGVLEYARLRDKLLPPGGVVQSEATLGFWSSYCTFYAGEDFLLAGEFTNGHFAAQELLGNPTAAPGIVKALGCEKGHFRAPGEGRILAMFLPLAENCPIPTYFAPAFD